MIVSLEWGNAFAFSPPAKVVCFLGDLILSLSSLYVSVNLVPWYANTPNTLGMSHIGILIGDFGLVKSQADIDIGTDSMIRKPEIDTNEDGVF